MTPAADAVRPRRWPWLLPLLAFMGLALLFLARLHAGDPAHLPSALVGRAAPPVILPPLPGLERAGRPVPGFGDFPFVGKITLLNVWASWCVPCHEEAPLLMQLAADPDLQIAGINYKDQPDNARRFLGRHGNPFTMVGVDPAGRAAIEWGVYGVPESFVIDRAGRVTFKLVGPITPDNYPTALQPALAAARAAARPR